MSGTPYHLFYDALDLGTQLGRLAHEHGEWSQATFGSDAERGPIGALKHLAKEANEAVEALEAVEAAKAQAEGPGATEAERKFDYQRLDEAEDRAETELADCLLLLLDASRRAGHTPLDLVRAAADKLEVNKARAWPAAGSVPDGQPVEHVPRPGEKGG